MTAPYYIGDAFPIKFKISDTSGAIKPSAVKVIVLTSYNTLTEEANATIDPDTPYEVSYTVPGSVNVKGGHYRAYCVCSLSYGERTHEVKYDILKNPER